MKNPEVVADKLSKAGFSLGWVSALDRQGRTIWIVDAHRDEKRFVVRADEILTAFPELERAIHQQSRDRTPGPSKDASSCTFTKFGQEKISAALT